MPTTTVRLSEETHRILRKLAADQGTTMTEVLQQAVEQLRRQVMLEQASAQYAALRQDPKAWAEVLAERKLFEQAIADGVAEE
ncbi:MAG: ribbon-helix-helix protein, CopG family [candidate division WS1 bacterium]|nr:ribbon-helix-helix protein, CopG family [candidate division WS1 bacterium]